MISVICGENVNYPNNKAEYCTFGGYHNQGIFMKGRIIAQNHSIKTPITYEKALELLINPVKFHPNGISSL